jgi:hypothetical protein
MAGQVKTLFDERWERRADVAGKPAMGFVSHGGGGKTRESLAEMAKHFKWKGTLGKWGFAFGIQGAPNETKDNIRVAAQMFLNAVLKNAG